VDLVVLHDHHVLLDRRHVLLDRHRVAAAVEAEGL
jgi:hypothetical protein